MTRREVLEAVKKALHTEAPTGATSSTKRTSPTIGVAVSKTLELGATNSTERTSLTGTMSSTDSTDSTDSIAPANLTDMVSSTAEQAPARQEIPWEYGKKTNIPDVLARFIERVIDYKATVRRAANSEEAAALVAEMLVQAKAASCVVPPGLDRQWYQQASEAGIHVCVDNPPLSKEALNNTAAVITAASVGIAETGTIALNHGPDQGRRIISLLPDTHICLIRADQIVTDVPEALALLEPSISSGQPITWVSGPSATVDIELIRVEGVHGPRKLTVIIVG